MSAHALKAETERQVGRLVDAYAEELISRGEDSPAQHSVRRGIIQGLRLALQAQAEAYKVIGG